MRARTGVLAAVVLVATAGCGNDGPPQLPQLALPALTTGQVLETSTLTGPAVVNLWAVWCVPCTAELPDFQRASEDHPDVRFIGVDETGFGEAAESVEFLADLGVTYEQFADADGELMVELDLSQLPATLIVDVDGEIAWVHQGQVSYDELVERLADL